MSRVGRKPIELPDKVSGAVSGQSLRIKGPKGELTIQLPDGLSAKAEAKTIVVARASEDRLVRSEHGLFRNLIANMVTGVQTGFQRDLEISGVGYKAEVDGRTLVLSLGFARPVRFEIPQGIDVDVDKGTRLAVKGIDKHKVGLVAAQIRGLRPPDPYKAKGIKYVDEVVRRKAGKAGATAAAS
ncbi:MAG: 50S ribosomal protein L6 [Deltaproteobacteria bacterium]|nr:50S ribosomal protein L6 [Deltaproteobacteria bacterium]